MGLTERKEWEFHKVVIAKEMPLSIGGGIGQSRLCMLILQKAQLVKFNPLSGPKK